MREKEKSTQIIFVRHGKPDFAHDRLYCDEREDPALTPEGVQHAEHAASLLSNEEIDIIISSPMKRALMTAAPIAEKKGIQLDVNESLKERPFGIWDGLYFNEIERDYPDEYLEWKKNPLSFVPEGGETIHLHKQRITNEIQKIIEKHTGKLIVIVFHVGPIRMCVSSALNMPLEGYRQLTIDCGSLTRIDYGKRQNNLVYLNRI